MIKKIIAVVCAVSLLMVGCVANTQQSLPATESSTVGNSIDGNVTTISVMDDLGRTVQLDSELLRIAPSGSVAQMILHTLAPELLVGWASNPGANTKPYIDEKYWQLPEFGQFYGKNVSLNMEALLTAQPQVIIDMGDVKQNMGEDLDGLSQQINLPVIFIEANLDTMAAAYRTLGKLLNREQRAEQLATYCERTMQMAAEVADGVTDSNRVSAYYGVGQDGLSCNAKGSIHATVLELVGVENAATVENVSQKGGGNQIDMEQLMLFDPDIVLLAATGIYDQVGSDVSWQQLPAIQSGNYYQIPNTPYDFLSSPPSMNRIIGLHWLAWVAYPELYKLDIREQLSEFYRLFYSYELTEQEIDTMLEASYNKTK